MPDLIKVAKFGGTSLADAEAMKRCAAIIAADPDKRVIVVSATSGTTNLLTSLTETGDRAGRDSLIREIEEKHLDILKKLKNPGEAGERVADLIKELRTAVEKSQPLDIRSSDEILSFGERLSSCLFTALLLAQGMDAEYIDAREIIMTDSHFGGAEPLIDQVRYRAGEKMSDKLKSKRLVTQGFIGSDKYGDTTTLGRGGSDYSAALFAEALDADVLEIWTDVNAIYSTDPRIVPDAEPITEITFDEAAELSVFGAKILHPATLKPAIRKNIRVYVGSSLHPGEPGTWIVRRSADLPVIRAISLRRNQTLVTVHSLDMLHRHGFLARLFQVLSDYKISVDLVTTSEVSVSLTIDTNHEGLRQRLSAEMLRELESIADVQVEKGLALVALVGNNLDTTAGVSGQLFTLLDSTNIRLICHGASTHNLCFLIDDPAAEKIIGKLHNHFISKKEHIK
ncbi:MAG: lysine-sensitive aspartokinase 3 [Balneolaceae bacterium]